MTDTKILLFTIVAFMIFSLYITQSVWAPSDDLTFVGNSHFQNLPTLYPGDTAKFTIKLWLDGPSQIHEIKPVIDVYPVSANSHVKLETDTLDHLDPNTAGTFHVTIMTDSEIPIGKIFLSVYFVAKDNYGKVVKGGWSERDSWIDVEQSPQSDSLATQLEQARQKIVQAKSISNDDYLMSPLKQFKLGIPAEEIKCKQNLELVIKANNGKPVCVTPETKIKLIKRGWATETGGNLVTLREGDREGSLLVQKIFQDSVSGLNFLDYPVARDTGSPITLHVGDTASNGCTVELTLVKISGSTATFLKKENQNRPCPICLSENAVIDTPQGNFKVKGLTVGMQVWTLDDLGHKQAGTILKIGKTLVPPTHKMVHLLLDDGRELFASPGHPTADGRLLGDLKEGDMLDNSKIKTSELVAYDENYTYDILPSGPTGFYLANGILLKSTIK